MSQTPIVRAVSWPNAAVNLLILLAMISVGWWLDHDSGALVGTALYLLCSVTLRSLIPRDHRAAIAHCKRQEFDLAIPRFERSLIFFERHPWIDRFRAVTMLSTAGMSYREMGLLSIAFCYAQLGDGARAREYYELCLRESPNNGMAAAALRLMDAACQSPTTK